MNKSALFEQATTFPESPGVYIFKDYRQEPIYIGKALNLRSRVKSYFLDDHLDRRQIPLMLQKLVSMDWIATNTEAEALILEANLIRSHKPRYNIDLRDDKHFPYIKITVAEPFPRLLVVRSVADDKALYFGPYTDAGAMRRVVSFARKLFLLRDCALALPLAMARRPCINHAMGRCCAPCAGLVSVDNYRMSINMVIRFLRGRRNDLLAELTTRMEQESAALNFEQAALLRDQIALITDAARLQHVDLAAPETDCDIFGFYSADRHESIAILHFREGRLLYKRNFLIPRDAWDFESTDRDTVLVQFYAQSLNEPPREIIVPPDSGFTIERLNQWFTGRFPDRTVAIVLPQKGDRRRLLEMAEKNARFYALQNQPPDNGKDLVDLQEALALPRLPQTIEAFDISNLGESFAVAGMVRFVDGRPDKAGYRKFRIKGVDGQNDFAMMMEAVSRRLTRLSNEQKSFPDLLLIDGGKGQLSAAMEPLKQYENAPMIVSLAKQEERLFSSTLPDGIVLPPTHPGRKLVERIRNEVHRYAITYHKKLRGKQFKASFLESISGVGPAKARLLLRTFGSIKKVKEAGVEEIAAVKGFSVESAQALLNALV